MAATCAMEEACKQFSIQRLVIVAEEIEKLSKQGVLNNDDITLIEHAINQLQARFSDRKPATTEQDILTIEDLFGSAS